MTSSLRKYKYTGSSGTRPNTSSGQSGGKSQERESSPSPGAGEMDISDLKSEILVSLKADISAVIKSELKNALAEDFRFLKSELQAVKTEIVSNNAALKSEIDHMKANIKEVEGGMSAWSDEVVNLQKTVSDLKTEMAVMKERCEDMEGRMRRCNIRIIGVPESPGSCSTTTVSKMLTEVLKLDKEPLIDRSHRSLGPRKPDGRPRAIVAKLHYHQDCLEVLRRARTQGQLRFDGHPITIFPDFTASVAKARAAFTGVRKLLRDRPGVRYGILFPARLRISYKGENKEFLDPDEAMVYVMENIVSSAESGD